MQKCIKHRFIDLTELVSITFFSFFEITQIKKKKKADIRSIKQSHPD